VQSRQE